MSDSYRKFVVGAIQASSVYMDREATTAKACKLIREAGRHGCELVGLPEAFIPIYPYWISVTTRSKGVSLYKQLYANSVDVPSATTAQLCKAARDAGTNVVVGINLREDQGPHRGCLFNAQLFIDRSGAILGVRRKLTPINVERAIWGVGDGSDLQVHQMSVGRVGGLICGEHTMETLRYALASAGEQLHVANWPGLFRNSRCWDWQGFGESVVRSYAMMGQMFVLNSCSIIDDDLMSAFERHGIVDTEEARNAMASRTGFSAIVGPFGNYVAGPELNNDESIALAEIDMEDIVEAKYAHNPLGYHDRWDVARLVVNRSRTAPVNAPHDLHLAPQNDRSINGSEDLALLHVLRTFIAERANRTDQWDSNVLLTDLERVLFEHSCLVSSPPGR